MKNIEGKSIIRFMANLAGIMFLFALGICSIEQRSIIIEPQSIIKGWFFVVGALTVILWEGWGLVKYLRAKKEKKDESEIHRTA